jgi:hypothetical protein
VIGDEGDALGGGDGAFFRGEGDDFYAILEVTLKTEMAEGESAAVIGPTRLPASRVASTYRCNRCEPESLVEPSTTPSSSLSIPVSRVTPDFEGAGGVEEFEAGEEEDAEVFWGVLGGEGGGEE